MERERQAINKIQQLLRFHPFQTLMEKSELIFIPWPLMGHLAQLVELAKLIINREKNFSITVLITRLPDSIDPVTNGLIDSLVASSANEALQFFHLPPTNPIPEWSSLNRGYFIQKQLESQKPHVKEFIKQRQNDQPHSSKLIGIVLDMFANCVIDVADDFGIPSYVFSTSGAGFLSLMHHFQTLQDEYNQDVCDQFSNSRTALTFPCFANPIPPSVLPIVLVDKQLWLRRLVQCAYACRRAKGIMINAFSELELYALDSFNPSESSHDMQKLPQIYPIGPLLNQVQHTSPRVQSETIKWLDNQPPCSVVYICFGSMASLEMDQVEELAYGLERSGYRFLWSLRCPPPGNNMLDFPIEYVNHRDVLPEGFLDRTSNIGKVVGWVPQLAVLSHSAVGGFVSHCGWNSILESIWCGVPIATWPLHSEQQLNAFQLVRELELSVGITLDYSLMNKNQALVTAEEIEKGVRKVMESDSEVRKKVKEMKDKSRNSMKQGGSSYESLGSLIDNMLHKTY